MPTRRTTEPNERTFEYTEAELAAVIDLRRLRGGTEALKEALTIRPSDPDLERLLLAWCDRATAANERLLDLTAGPKHGHGG